MSVVGCEKCGGSHPFGKDCGFCEALELVDTTAADHVIKDAFNKAVVDVLDAAEQELKRAYDANMGPAAEVSPFPGVFTVIAPEASKRFMDTLAGEDSFGPYRDIEWTEGETVYVLGGANKFVVVLFPDFVCKWPTF